MRHPTPEPPEDAGTVDGLAYALFAPPSAPAGGVVIVHGAGSRKESHFDFARACRAQGLAAVSYDQRGHGASEGPCDARLIDDAATVATLLGDGPIAMRGSSMGGYVAILAGHAIGAKAIVAICPAGAEHLRRMLRRDDLEFDADVAAIDGLLTTHELGPAVDRYTGALLVLHAEGDERIPVEHSRQLIAREGPGPRRLVAVPGGHHRSVQHDGELQGLALRWIARALAS